MSLPFSSIFLSRLSDIQGYPKGKSVRKSSVFQRGGLPRKRPEVLRGSSPLQALIEAQLHTGQVAGLSNGVKAGVISAANHQCF